MSMIFCTENEFSIKEINGSKLLCNNIQGFFLVLFYSTECPYCKEMIQIFKQLPGTIGGCQFGVINVSKNKKCIIDSMKTQTPIKFVPMCILYNNGTPIILYKGPRNLQDIQQFVVEVSQKMKDRIKIIYLKGFKTGDKIEIAKKYSIPKIIKDIGFNPEEFKISDEILEKLIQDFCKEKGVRKLEKCLETIIMKLNLFKMTGIKEYFGKNFNGDGKNLTYENYKSILESVFNDGSLTSPPPTMYC